MTNRKVHILAFTDHGMGLAQQLAAKLGGIAERSRDVGGVRAWTKEHFATGKKLVYVGALGIAVRALAPYLVAKDCDPAVVVVDEDATFAISVLSGHLGGANRLAHEAACACGATPVITTATDVTGHFAIDVWAADNGCVLEPLSRVQVVSSSILAGETVVFRSDYPILGTCPSQVVLDVVGCKAEDENGDSNESKIQSSHMAESSSERRLDRCPDIVLSAFNTLGPWLKLTPQIAVLGVGCRRGVSQATLERALGVTLQACDLDVNAISCVASIDLKAHEDGLIAFCETHDWPLLTFSAEELSKTPGSFSASEFVKHITGVDNVCERACVCAAGGTMLQPKTVHESVTMAIALKPYAPVWPATMDVLRKERERF